MEEKKVRKSHRSTWWLMGIFMVISPLSLFILVFQSIKMYWYLFVIYFNFLINVKKVLVFVKTG